MGAPRSATLVVYIAIGILSLISIGHQPAGAQRSLHHWKRDLEHRLRIYQEHRDAIADIISSSIYPTRGDMLVRGPVRVSSRSNVRFSDLIVPAGALSLNPAGAQSAVRILVDRTRAYIDSKATELFAVRNQLDSMRAQLDASNAQFIYKGRRPSMAQFNYSAGRVIKGSRVFRQARYASLVATGSASLASVNSTDVSRVLDDTYLRNTKFAARDSKGRLYFEGRKTFWNTVFTQELESGCCGRLRPVDTSRVMTRSAEQNVRAPVLIQTGPGHRAPGAHALVRRLASQQLYNQYVVLNAQFPPPPPVRPAPADIGLLPAGPPENFIQPTNLVRTRQLDQSEILKTLIFQGAVAMDEVLLSPAFDGRLVIGVASSPAFQFDLVHDNYLLRYVSHQGVNYSQPVVQRLAGVLVLDGPANFVAGAEASSVNGLDNFGQFVRDSVVRIDRPSLVHGPVQFNALPAMLGPQQRGQSAAGHARQPQSVLIMHVRGGLDVGSINGMRVPQDLVILPSERAPGAQNSQHALRPGQSVFVRGPRHFANLLEFAEFLTVDGTVNNIPLPGGVIPLHLNDYIDSVGRSSLWFLDGVDTVQLTTQSNQFDEINLSEVNGGAQSLVMRSMLAEQPDGSFLIRAPLRVTNLRLVPSEPNTGLLNGFRPEEILELNPHYPYDTLYGRKTFLAPVEATDCVFGSINRVANWTNRLVRIDRPNTVQTVHTKLAFGAAAGQPAALNVHRLQVDFHPDNSPANYRRNWDLSPEFYLLQQALQRDLTNATGGRFRVGQVRLMGGGGDGRVNGVPLDDVATLDGPLHFPGRFTMVGKVEVASTLQAGRVQSNYPIDAMDLVQFDKYRIPLVGNTQAPIRLNNLVLGPENQASFVTTRLLNGTPFSQFAASIMSLTRPQEVEASLVFDAPVGFEGLVATRAALNGVKDFRQFAGQLRGAKYSFEKGLQCNSVVVRS